MSREVEFELNLPGLNEIMKSGEMQSILSAAGHQVAAAAGEGFDSEVGIGSYAAIGNVYPTDAESAHEAYKNNALVKALGSSGLDM